MLERIIRVIVGLILIFTSPLTILPSLVVWILTERFYLTELFEWCLFGSFKN